MGGYRRFARSMSDVGLNKRVTAMCGDFTPVAGYNRDQAIQANSVIRPPLICILAACLLATACSSMLIGGSNPGSGRIGDDKRTEQQISEDAAISAAVRRRFNLDSAIAASSIGIATHLQTVTLSGTVGSFDIRDRAVSIARSTDKVRSVNNQIQVNSKH